MAYRKFSDLGRRGLTLIEAAMVLGIATLVIGGLMAFFQSANMNSRTNEAISQVSTIRQAVRAVYAGSSDYSGLTTRSLANAEILPLSMVIGSGSTASLRHAFSGLIVVTSADVDGGSPNHYRIKFQSLPAEACAKLATTDFGAGLFNITVGTITSGIDSITSTKPLTPRQAAENCGPANDAVIHWRFS